MAGDNKTTKLPAGEILDIRTPNRNLPGTRTRTFSVPAFPFFRASTAYTIPECKVCILTQKSGLRGKRTGFLKTKRF